MNGLNDAMDHGENAAIVDAADNSFLGRVDDEGTLGNHNSDNDRNSESHLDNGKNDFFGRPCANHGNGTAERSSLIIPNRSSYMAKRPNYFALIRQFWRYCGPGYMIAVGYMDPGNWATDLEAGSRYGYALLFVILLSNVMAMILQHLCVRLGVTARMDLAEACRARMPKWANLPMYLIAEVAIISCDLSEVIGTAIALKLLFGIPIVYGVLITVCDVLLLLGGLGSGNESSSYRLLEALVMILMTVIGVCFVIELLIVKPEWGQVFRGFLPFKASRLVFTDRHALFSALGIIGATVMPHNLYLHSSIVQHNISNNDEEDSVVGSPTDCSKIDSIINWSTIDSTVALFFALFINSAILITAAAAFYSRGRHEVHQIEEASALMREWLGPVSAIVFGFALLAAGQSSAVTGTVAGQIVFEGHLKMRMAPWVRRLVTRGVAIIPALLIILLTGEESVNELLIYSQVILSVQLPFAIIPLIVFTFTPDEQAKVDPKMIEYWTRRGHSKWEWWLKSSAVFIAGIMVVLNLMFLATAFF